MRTITNRELPLVKNLLARLNGVPDIRLAYASAKTIKLIENELRDLDLVRQPDDDFRQFTSELESVKQKWARKRASGEPATRLDRMGEQMIEVYDIPAEDMDSYRLEAERIEKECLEAVQRQRNRERNYEELLDQPTNCRFHLVNPKDVKHLLLPDEEGKTKLTGAQFTALAFLLSKPTIKMDMIPKDISQTDMLTLIDYFEI